MRGPVCILAGAGSGKTTTITRRIANQVASKTFDPSAVLAVTFTDKAAGEMRRRLEVLGITGVRARTFHAAALAQLRHLAGEPLGEILPSKVVALRHIANSLPKPYKFRPASDLATEVEWARNRMIGPDQYRVRLGNHEPPIPSDLMERVYREYERRKAARGLVDFEDLLALAIRMFDADDWALERFHAKYQAFTVDEYQDVNLLQQSLLERWLGERDELCVVGDDYQSIYSFTGASPQYLLEMPRRFHGTTVIRLEENYRSTPQILDVANRLVPHLGGAEKTLRPTRPPSSQPDFKFFKTPEEEVEAVVKVVQGAHEEGVPLEEIAILYRANFRSEEFETALSKARIPFQVRDGGFLTRPAARRLLPVMVRSRATDVTEQVRRLAVGQGYQENLPEDLGEQETTRQNDLERLIELATEFEDGQRTVADFAADLAARFGNEGAGRGVNLLTYHRAKGLEFETVLLPRLLEGEIPFRRAITADALDEERRLLYVGITRAKSRLMLSWTFSARTKPSRFLTEIGLGIGPTARRSEEKVEDSECVKALKRWRLKRATADGVPAYVVLHDSTLSEIANALPGSQAGLAAVPGIGPAKLEKYGAEILDVLAQFR